MSNKYHARKTNCNYGHKHDSNKEAKACNLLHYLQKTGKIKNLVVFPKFTLFDGYTRKADGKKIRPISYTADFSFWDNEQNRGRVIDIKGIRTEVYKLKKKWFDRVMNDHNMMIEEEI